MTKNLKENANLQKILKIRKAYVPQKNEKNDEGHQHRKFNDKFGKASGVPGVWSTRCDYEDDFIKRIKNWQFNHLADEIELRRMARRTNL